MAQSSTSHIFVNLFVLCQIFLCFTVFLLFFRCVVFVVGLFKILIVSVCVVFGGTATHNELVLFLIYIKVIIKIWKRWKKISKWRFWCWRHFYGQLIHIFSFHYPNGVNAMIIKNNLIVVKARSISILLNSHTNNFVIKKTKAIILNFFTTKVHTKFQWI